MNIATVTTCTDELLEGINALLPQLSSSATALTLDQLAAIIASDAITLFTADIDGVLVGTLTLATFPIPTGIRAWIEDVVVDTNARGHGVGEALTKAAVAHAAALGAKTVDLTSRPSREAANALYRKVGFVQRETNVYRFTID
jgi:ribosomal protein S18 acetylase RimI-like enzyme